MSPIEDVFTADEVARAVGVPLSAVLQLSASGALPRVAGARFYAMRDIAGSVDQLRAAAALGSVPRPSIFARTTGEVRPAPPSPRPLVVSCALHAVLFVAALSLPSGTPGTVIAAAPAEPEGLVFLVVPGPGGGGGGSGARDRRPPSRISRAGDDAISVPALKPEPDTSDTSVEVPAPPPPPEPVAAPQPAEPPPAAAVTAPIVATAAGADERAGVIDSTRAAASAGSGTGNNAGTGRGTGAGAGLGAGIGEGEGGGIGGGPYRPGNGIRPPRLLREVKAEYSEEARRKGITGDVILEIVVRRDGRVGEITVLRGLGAGLDERAIAAVRQWQFSAAQRQGQAVDVLVEVAVEFSLR